MSQIALVDAARKKDAKRGPQCGGARDSAHRQADQGAAGCASKQLLTLGIEPPAHAARWRKCEAARAARVS